MLFIPEEIKDRLRTLAKEAPSDPVGAAYRMVEVWPSSAVARHVLAGQALQSGDMDRAETLAWEALNLEPCTPAAYIGLGAILTARNEADVIAKRLRHLALWKLAFSSSVPEGLAFSFKASIGEADSRDPATYEMLAMFEDVATRSVVDPPEVAERLRPFRLLNELQRDSRGALAGETLSAITEHAAVCAPLFRNALRQWGADANAIDEDALCLLVAILGEIAEADAADELLELTETGSKTLFLHANWAIFRLGQRFPEAVFERFRALREGASVGLRCAMADHVNLLPDLEGDVAFLTELLEDFDGAADAEELGYLLALVAHALREREHDEAAKSLVTRYQGQLPREQRRWLNEALGAEEGMISLMVRERIDEMDIEDICLSRRLLEVEDDDDEEDDLDEEDLIPVPPRPGRNEPCWCGSGKKYKKCHLTTDEEEDRARNSRVEPDEEPVSLQMVVVHSVMTAAKEWHRKNDLRKAALMYFGTEEVDIDTDDEEAARFSEWLLIDFRDANTRQTAVENYLRTRATKLTRPEREMLESLRDSRYSVFQVKSTEPASGVHLQDLCTGEILFVHHAAGEFVELEVLAARLQYLEGRYIFAGAWMSIPEDIPSRLMPALGEESRAAGQDFPQYVRGQAHRIHRLVKELG